MITFFFSSQVNSEASAVDWYLFSCRPLCWTFSEFLRTRSPPADVHVQPIISSHQTIGMSHWFSFQISRLYELTEYRVQHVLW